MAEKNEEENITKYQSTDRHNTRIEFWAQLLKGIKEDKNFNLFDNINPSKDNYIEASSSIPNVGYVFRVTKDYVRIELCIHNSNKEYNEYIFDQLYKNKENIENVFG